MQKKPAPDRAKQKAKHEEQPPPRAVEFGDVITADHMITDAADNQGIGGEKAAVVVRDLGTRMLDCYPVPGKSHEDAVSSLQQFVGAKEEVKEFYSDASPELAKASKVLGWRHPQATPGRPDTNGIAESSVKEVIHGSRANLEQAGLEEQWWPFAARHYCFGINTEVIDGDSSWNRRHRGKGNFRGIRLPSGCLINLQPSPTQETA